MNFANPEFWPSLLDQTSLAQSLFHEKGPELVSAWLETQVARVDNPSFARLFPKHIALPNIVESDFCHRIIHSNRGSLLGGIRFYKLDLTRPFVEVIAHSFGDLNDLVSCVVSEWKPFEPIHMRTLQMPGASRLNNSYVDTSVYLGRYQEMKSRDGRVTLAPFADVTQAISLIETRFAHLKRESPDLWRNISPASADDLRQWHRDGELYSIQTEDATAGLIAAPTGSIEWIEGDEMSEEVVAVDYAGQRHAASAQTELAFKRRDRGQRFLIGTIDSLNLPSRRSAERAGRFSVLDYVFTPLDS